MKSKLTITALFVFVFVELLCITLGFGFTKGIIYNDKLELDNKINDIFGNNQSVVDGVWENLSGFYTDNNKMHYMPLGIVFKIQILNKEAKGYSSINYFSKDLNYTKPESIYNFRPLPFDCYQKAFQYLLVGDVNGKKQIHQPGKFLTFEKFPEGLETKYHYLAISRDMDFNDQISEGFISDKYFKVMYSQNKLVYELYQKDSTYKKTLITNLIISSFLGLILCFVLFLIIKRKFILLNKYKLLFNIKWIDLDNGVAVLIKNKQIYKFKIHFTVNNKLMIGRVVFDDNTMTFKFGDVEYFYRIERLSEECLELIDITSKRKQKFVKITSLSKTNVH